MRRSSLAGARVSMVTPAARQASATATGSCPTPPLMPMKTGPAGAAAARRWMPRTASMRERPDLAASKSCGMAARSEISYALPA
ncbi:hypothetical protein M2266_005487 [Streptomyces sp. SPB162]|nr:hypothetical protein [Streptomyces sp. SPB162]